MRPCLLDRQAATSAPDCKGPAEAAGDPDEPAPAKILWNARDYFDEHRERIRYDMFRRHGLPMSSTHVESGIKQTNRRVHEGQVRRRGSYRSWKGSEKAWYLEHAEEMLALRCQALSEDGRWDSYFDRLRRGEIELQTPSRQRARTDGSLPQGPQQEKAA